jgi:hypothetical protein
MKLLSQELVSLDYRDHLRNDLARATVCRFLVAYVSIEGLESINTGPLAHAFRDPRSFGVSSLSCSCGFEPLLWLHQRLGNPPQPKLKYFMDPMPDAEQEEPKKLALFHSKLVYLAQERERKSIVYIGSHNWTGRALGPHRPRNAEASVRLEMEYDPDQLEGKGGSVASDVNRHLLQAWAFPACLPATEAYRTTFEQWYETGCRRSSAMSLDEVAIILAVRKADGITVSPSLWQGLVGRGIYLQALEEAEGELLWRRNDQEVLVLVWNSRADLQAGRQPIILRCRITTSKAGPDSRRHGTNQSTAPVAGFRAVIFDESQLAAMHQSAKTPRSVVPLWSGRTAELYDFEFPTPRLDSSQVDGTITPKYQFHFEVEHVAFSAEGNHPEAPEMVWGRETFAVAESKNSVKREEIDGYYVPPDMVQAILGCLEETLFLEPEAMKVRPVSEYKREKVGKRFSFHPLHDTFIGEDCRRQREEFYSRADPDFLTAELDEPPDAERPQRQLALPEEPVHRIQRVFTTPLSTLEALWTETARRLRARKGERGTP